MGGHATGCREGSPEAADDMSAHLVRTEPPESVWMWRDVERVCPPVCTHVR